MKLDLSNKTAHVKPVDVKYYTSIREHTDIFVVGGSAAYPSPEASTALKTWILNTVNVLCICTV